MDLDFPLIILGGGSFLFYKGFKWWDSKRLIENTPTSKVRSLAMGFVEVYGEVAPYKGKPFIAPFSKKPCVWCKWSIEHYVRRGKSSHWVTLKSGTLSNHFILNDGTGSVLVDTEGATVEIPLDFEAESGIFKGLTPTILSSIEGLGVQTQTFLGLGKKLRVREYYLALGDKTYIMGMAGKNPFAKEGTNTKNEAGIMIQKGKHFYYISDKAEKDVLKSYRLKVFGGLLGGAGLILFGLWLLFLELGMM